MTFVCPPFGSYHLLKMGEAYPEKPFARCKTAGLSRNFENLLVCSKSGKKRPGHSYETLTNDLILVTGIDSSRKLFFEKLLVFSRKQARKTTSHFFTNPDCGYLILVTIDRSRKKFFSLKVCLRFTEKQCEKSFVDSRFSWQFSRSGITNKVFDDMALVFGFPTYYPMSR